MKYLLVLLIAACTPGVIVVPTPTMDVGVETALAHTRKMTKPSGCTAVAVGKGFVLTAKHCVDELLPGAQTDVGVFLYWGGTDFAVLVDPDDLDHRKACIRNPRLGEHTYAVGWPAQRASDRRALVITEGVISTIVADHDGEIRTSTPIYFGNSGGGLWGTDGCLLGLTVSGVIDTAENYIVPSWEFSQLVP